MAEIKIEKKSPVWPWILLGLLVIGGLIYYYGYRNNDEPGVVQTPPAKAEVENDSVAQYIQYVNEGRTMSLDHEYTNGALLRLISAINAKAQQTGFDVKADLEKVTEHANQISEDPFETTHANSIRKAADILTDAMQNMQKAKYPNLTTQSDEVRSAANAINPDKLTLDQRDAVKSFFTKSADLLQNMN
jgi:hypothetical protein